MVDTILKKSQVVESFRDLPEEVTADDLIERILFIQLIEQRIKSAESGNIVTTDQVMSELRKLRAEKMATAQRNAA
ncbi:MAG: hypothetical protein H7Z72_12980 [Bacteroidetes bacterium]|nr:hypothetical protein [Fibrella sp.]